MQSYLYEETLDGESEKRQKIRGIIDSLLIGEPVGPAAEYDKPLN